MLLCEHYLFFLGFDVIGIPSGFAPYADVTDVHVACTRFWSSCNSEGISPCFSVFVLSCLLFSRVSAPHTRSTLFGPGLAIA